MDELYGQEDAGSKTQANLATVDAIGVATMVTGTSVVAKNSVNSVVDNALDDINVDMASAVDADGAAGRAIDTPRPVTNTEAQEILEERYIAQGATPEQAEAWAKETVDSFEGQITTKELSRGDTRIVTHSKDGYTRGVYTTVDSAGKTNVERQTNLALPYGNTADIERTVTVVESHTALEGTVADQSSNTLYFPSHATGGGKQSVVDSELIVIDIEPINQN